jgi:hypothetical protein
MAQPCGFGFATNPSMPPAGFEPPCKSALYSARCHLPLSGVDSTRDDRRSSQTSSCSTFESTRRARACARSPATSTRVGRRPPTAARSGGRRLCERFSSVQVGPSQSKGKCRPSDMATGSGQCRLICRCRAASRRPRATSRRPRATSRRAPRPLGPVRDATIMGDYWLPKERFARVATPTLVLDGGASPPMAGRDCSETRGDAAERAAANPGGTAAQRRPGGTGAGGRELLSRIAVEPTTYAWREVLDREGGATCAFA